MPLPRASVRRQSRRAARTSLRTRPLRPEELSVGAVRDAHVQQRSVSETHLSPGLLFEALAPRPPSEGSVGSGHLDGELAGRVEELESLVQSLGLEVSSLRSEVSYLRGLLSGGGLL